MSTTITTGKSFIDYKSTGAETQFVITMDLIAGREKQDLKVYQDGVLKTVDVDYTQDATKVTFLVAPLADEIISLVRDTSSNTRLVDFDSITVVTKAILDLDSLQDFYLAQEAFDAPKRAIQYNVIDKTVNMQPEVLDDAYRIINLADPIDPQDGATKFYVDAQSTIVLQEAKDYSDAQDLIQDGVLSTLMDTKDDVVRTEQVAGDLVLQNQIDPIQTKLDTIEVGATADQDASEIEALYESNLDTNKYTDAEKAKLAALSQLGGIAEWTSGAAYLTDVLVWEGTDFYRAVDDHTSGATFIDDAAHWEWFSSSMDDTRVAKVGDTMTGPLVMDADLTFTGGKLDIGAPPDNTQQTTGIVMSGASRVFHGFSYGDNGTVTPDGKNLFIGSDAGNFTMGATATSAAQASRNIGIGEGTLGNLSTGYKNIGIGANTLASISSSFGNVAIGNNSSTNSINDNNVVVGNDCNVYNVSGNRNTIMGTEALQGTPSQNNSYNVAMGFKAAKNAYGTHNVYVGTEAANGQGAGSRNIAIGASTALPNLAGSNQLNIGNLIYGNTLAGSKEATIDGILKADSLELGGVVSETFTSAEKTKLSNLESSRFLGTYIDLDALNTAHPTANEGEYANIDSGVAGDVTRYLWDNSDNAWILGAGGAMTPLEVKTAYESNNNSAYIKTEYELNADTNAFTDANLAKLTGIEDSAQVNTVTEDNTVALTNKTLADVSNDIHANIMHFEVQATEVITKGDVLVAVGVSGDTNIKVAKRSALTQPVIGIAGQDIDNGLLGSAVSIGVIPEVSHADTLNVGDVLYPDGSGGLTKTPTTLYGNYNQPIAHVIKRNPVIATLMVNIHSGHEFAELIAYDNSLSDMNATNVQDAVTENFRDPKGSPSQYLLLDADKIKVAEFTNNLTTGTFTEDVTETGNKKYLLTNAIGASGDVVYSKTLLSDAKSRRLHIVKIYNSAYTGTINNVSLVITDQADNILETVIIDPAKNYQSKTISVPASATGIKVKPTIVTAEDSTWTFDKIAFDYEPMGEITIEKKELITFTNYLSKNASNYYRFKTLMPRSVYGEIITQDNTGDHTRIIALSDCFATLMASHNSAAEATQISILIFDANNVQIPIDPRHYQAAMGGTTLPFFLNRGDYAVVQHSGGTPYDDTRSIFSVTASATADYVTIEDEREQAHLPAVVYAAGNATQAVSIGTAIPFTEVVDNQGAFDGATYTIQDGDAAVSFNGVIYTNSSVSKFLDLYLNGALYKRISDSTTESVLFFKYMGYKGEFTTDDTLDVRCSESFTLINNTNYHYLNITETYLPPVEQATQPIVLAAPKQYENDYRIVVDSAQNITDQTFSGITVTKNSVGDYTVDYSSLGLTSDAIVTGQLATNEWDLDIRIPKIYVTSTSCNVLIRAIGSSTYYDRGFTLTISRGNDHNDVGVIGVGDVKQGMNHSTTEFWTGDYWIDGRKIYGKVLEWAGSSSVSFTVGTMGVPSLTIVDFEGTATKSDGLQTGLNYAGDIGIYYDPASGDVVMRVDANTWIASRVLVTYVK